MCTHQVMKILRSSNEELKLPSAAPNLRMKLSDGVKCNKKVRHKEDVPQVLTRNGLRLKNRENRIARRNRINQRRVGKRSSLRLNKPMTNVIKVNRASRQAVDLCCGMSLDGDPSKKLLFMLSLGLVPKSDKFHGPVVQIRSISNISDEVSKSAKSVTCQSAKENVEDGLIRSCYRVEEAHVHSLSERKLRSNQYVSNNTGMKPQRITMSACKQRTNKDSKITRNISLCLKTDTVSKRLNSENPRYSFRGFPFMSSRVRPSRKEVICIDLTKNEEEILLIVPASEDKL